MVKKQASKKGGAAAEQENPLFAKRTRNFRIGGDIQPKRDLYRFVRWPEYIQLQRKKRILMMRLKTPPPIAQFTNTIDKSQTTALFRLLNKYKPESKAAKKERLHKAAAGEEEAKKPKTAVLKYGLKNVTGLVENAKAKLVVIAFDVDPIELVVWLPTLCKDKDVSYCIVKGKSKLGKLVGKKTCTAVAITEVRKEDVMELELLTKAFRSQFNDNKDARKTWGGGLLGPKSQRKLEKREQLVAAEKAKKAGF